MDVSSNLLLLPDVSTLGRYQICAPNTTCYAILDAVWLLVLRAAIVFYPFWDVFVRFAGNIVFFLTTTAYAVARAVMEFGTVYGATLTRVANVVYLVSFIGISVAVAGMVFAPLLFAMISRYGDNDNNRDGNDSSNGETKGSDAVNEAIVPSGADASTHDAPNPTRRGRSPRRASKRVK